MFAAKVGLTIAHTCMTLWGWYEYFRTERIARQLSPEILASLHYHDQAWRHLLFMSIGGVLLWSLLIWDAFKRDRAA